MKTLPSLASLASLALAAALLATAPACNPSPAFAAPPGAEAPHRRTLTVTGTATLDLVPDCADVTLGLSTQGARPKLAISQLRKKQQLLLEALVAAGVKSSDVKVSGLSLAQTYDPKGVPTGFEASITVVASTRDFDLVADIMDTASGVGTQRMSTAFRVSDLPSYKQKVRRMALEAAKAKAKETVDALDATLGKVSEISESAGEYRGGAITNSYNASEARQGGGQLNPELDPLTLTVNVTYELG